MALADRKIQKKRPRRGPIPCFCFPVVCVNHLQTPCQANSSFQESFTFFLVSFFLLVSCSNYTRSKATQPSTSSSSSTTTTTSLRQTRAQAPSAAAPRRTLIRQIRARGVARGNRGAPTLLSPTPSSSSFPHQPARQVRVGLRGTAGVPSCFNKTYLGKGGRTKARGVVNDVKEGFGVLGGWVGGWVEGEAKGGLDELLLYALWGWVGGGGEGAV